MTLINKFKKMAFSLKESSSCSFNHSFEHFGGFSEVTETRSLYKDDKQCIRCGEKFGLSFTIYKKKY